MCLSLKFLDPVNNIELKVLLTCTLIFVYLYSLALSVNGRSLSKIDSSCKINYSNRNCSHLRDLPESFTIEGIRSVLFLKTN